MNTINLFLGGSGESNEYVGSTAPEVGVKWKVERKLTEIPTGRSPVRVMRSAERCETRTQSDTLLLATKRS